MADIVASIGLDSAEAQKAIAELSARIDKLLSSIGVVKIGVDADVSKAEASVKGAKTKLEAALGKGLGVKVDADTEPGIKAIRDSKGRFVKAGEEAGDGASSGFKNAFSGGFLGGALGGIVSAVAGDVFSGLGDAITDAKDFETGMQSLSAVTGATGPLLDDLGNRARNLATQFGGSANEQLTVFQTTLSKIGPQLAESPEALAKFAENVNILGKTDSALGAAGAVDALTSSLLQFGVNVNDSNEVAEQSSRFINVLAASAAVGSASVGDVAQAVAVVGATAKNANVSFEETNAALQVLASKSLTGSQAGTALTSVLVKLQAQSKDGDDALKALGTSSAELGQLLTTGGIGPAISKLREAMAKLGTQAEKNALLNKLFGEGGQNAAAALLGGEAMLAQFTEGVTGTNSATEQAAINMDTFAERISRLKAEVGDAFIGAFQAIAPIVSKVLDDVLPRITNSVKAIFTALAPTFQVIGTIIGGAVYVAIQAFVAILEKAAAGFSVIAPLIPVIAAGFLAYAAATNAAAIATTVAAAKQAILNVVMGANPIGAVIIGITALVAGLGALADALEFTAAEQLDEAEATKKGLEAQIQSNDERRKSVQSTQALVEEFKNLASNTNRTAEQEKRLKTIQGELDAQYPALIDNTKSFAENLDGVDKIGKLASESMNKISKEAAGLQKSLAETNKQIAGLKRNVALEELADSFGTVNLLGRAAENQFRRQLRERVNTFTDLIYKATTSDEVANAQASLLDFLRIEGTALNDDTQLQDVISKVLNAANAATAALNTWKGATKELADTTGTVTPPPPPDPDGENAKSAKDTASALEEALKKYKEQTAVIEGNTKLIKTQSEVALAAGKITQEAFDATIRQAEADALTAKYKAALDTLQAQVDDLGLFVNTTIKLEKDETDLEIRTILAELAKTRGYSVPVRVTLVGDNGRQDATDSILEFARQTQLRIKPLVFTPEVDDSLIKTDDLFAKLFGIGEALTGTVTDKLTGVGEEANKVNEEQVAALKKQLKDGEIAYVDYAKKVDEIYKGAGEKVTLFEKIVAKVNDKVSDTLGAILTKVGTKYADLTAKVADGNADISDAFGLMATTAGLSFAQMVVDGQNAFKAMLLAALDALQALVPILVAQITGVNLAAADNIATFGTSGIARAGLFTALLQGLVTLARAAVQGFATGGLVKGGEKLIRINERGEEYVMNHTATKQYQPLLDAMNYGTPLRADIARKLNLDKLGITFADQTQRGMSAVAVLREQGDAKRLDKLISQNADLNHKVELLTKEVIELRKQNPTTINTTTRVEFDDRALDRRILERTTNALARR